MLYFRSWSRKGYKHYSNEIENATRLKLEVLSKMISKVRISKVTESVLHSITLKGIPSLM